jgi:hypothetical protein
MEAVGRAVMTRLYAYVPPIASFITGRDFSERDFDGPTISNCLKCRDNKTAGGAGSEIAPDFLAKSVRERRLPEPLRSLCRPTHTGGIALSGTSSAPPGIIQLGRAAF